MKQPRAWQRMLSGRRLDLLDPTPVDIEVEDIAHGLAFVARWNGQTVGNFAYSVAEHSLLVEQIFLRLHPKASPAHRLTALLHDASEYVIGDMISPVKASVGPGYDDLDKRLSAAIHIRFGLPAVTASTLKKQIKKAVKRNKVKRRLRNIMNDLIKKVPINFNLSYLAIAKTTMLNNEYQVIKETLFQDFKKIK